MNYLKYNFGFALNFSIVILLINILCFKFYSFQKEYKDLAMCVLSSRNNYEFRNAIRSSWFHDITSLQFTHHDKTVITKFVVGQSTCSIHPENRIDYYGCERWNISIPESSELSAFSLKSSDNPVPYRFFQNAYVKAMHGIVLKRIGVANIVLQLFSKVNESTSIEISVFDAATDEEIALTHFSVIHKGSEENGYFYKPVQEILLPKGYEFIVQLKMNVKSKWLERTKTWINTNVEDSHHGILVIKPTDEYGHLINILNNANYIPAISFMFSVHSIVSLSNHYELISERDKEWHEKLNLEAQKLQEEQKFYQDMIMVDVVDVYRNLPEKVLACHQWINDNYVVKYVLKTDDDCYVNITNVLESLPDVGTDGDMIWWGNFRTNWAVEQHGKWGELEYGSMIYPRFACGSGNVVSYSVHSWLMHNKLKLNHFQGEDVSVGIWLSGLNVQYIQDDRWRCAMSCENDMMSLPELAPEKIQWYWNNSKNCATPCSSC